MNRWIIGIILLCNMVQGIFAQNIELKGRICDMRSKEGVAFANVILQTMDSLFIAGVATDEKGLFAIGKIKAGDYLLVVSSLGYEPEYVVLKELSKSKALGDLFLGDAAVSLDNVTVTASAQTTQSDRKIVFPSDRQLKASSNGMDLLQQMMLPRLQVDMLNSQIKVTGNGVIQLRINGVEVGQEEIKALIPGDIIRIEYHDNPGLRYGNADVVLDYIVRRPETGGSISTIGTSTDIRIIRAWYRSRALCMDSLEGRYGNWITR